MQNQLPAREARVGESWSSAGSSPLLAPKITINKGPAVDAAGAGATAGEDRRKENARSSMDLMDRSSDSNLEEGQTWLVMEYCNKGCLQVGLGRLGQVGLGRLVSSDKVPD